MLKKLARYKRPVATVALVSTVLLASWMGTAVYGGYFVYGWGPVTIVLAAAMLVASVVGGLRVAGSGWSLVATALFASYAAWTFLSLLWSPNRGDAWLGAGQTLLYLLAFWVTVGLVSSGASRRWALIASVLGPAVVAAFTLMAAALGTLDLFEKGRLLGSIGYYNGEAAFLLVPLWVGIYLAGSRSVNPVLRGLVLAGAVVSVGVAVLAQSRGAMVAVVVSLPVFFLLSGQRLRGLLALLPVGAALFVAFPDLNDVYRQSLGGGSPVEALGRAFATVWAAATGAGLYGLAWGLVDRWWKPPTGLVRAVGGIVLICVVVALGFGTSTAYDRVGDPVAWGQRKVEAFKTNDRSGQEQSRYLSASGQGRYTLWRVARKDFNAHPLLGVGTQNYEATYYLQRGDTVGFVRQPHMLPLEVLAERGVVGGVLFFGFLAACLAAGLWRRFERLNAEGKALVGAVVASVAYWFVHSCADWFWQIPAVTLPVMVYLALLVGSWRDAGTPSPRWPLRLIAVGVAAAAIAAVAPLYVADRYLAQSHAAMNPRAALMAVEKAEGFNPVNPYLRQREAELASHIGDWPRAEDSYAQAIRLNPEHYGPYYSLARFREKRGELEEALSLYRKASALNPLDKEIDRRVTELEARVSLGGEPASHTPDGNTE